MTTRGSCPQTPRFVDFFLTYPVRERRGARGTIKRYGHEKVTVRALIADFCFRILSERGGVRASERARARVRASWVRARASVPRARPCARHRTRASCALWVRIGCEAGGGGKGGIGGGGGGGAAGEGRWLFWGATIAYNRRYNRQ